MADSAYALYTPPNTPRIAGKARAKTAKRDKWGRFMPNVGDLLPPDKHGVIGGTTRANTAKRDSKGRFIKTAQKSISIN